MELKFRGFKVSTKITKIKTPRNFQRIRYIQTLFFSNACMLLVVVPVVHYAVAGHSPVG